MASERPPLNGEPGTSWNDPKTPGLRVRYFKNGNHGWYIFFRTKAGVQRNMRIGDFAAYTLTAARERALAIRRDVAEGNDPAKSQRAGAERKTMADLADWHIERHVRVKLKPSAEKKARQRWDNHILPALKAKTFVDEVTESDVMALHHKLRKTPVQANRVMAQLSKAFNLAGAGKQRGWGWCPRHSNPVQVEKFPEAKRRRKPENDEPVRLMVAMEAMRSSQPAFIGFVEIVALTGARASEILGARREWIRDGVLHLPDSKTGPKTVAMPSLAIDVVNEIPRMADNPWLIPGRGEDARMVSYWKRWRDLLKKASIKDLRLHDLRRFFASAGLSSGESLSAIGQVLGHTQAQTTMRYAFLMTDQQQATAEVAATRVRKLMTDDGKIARIRRA